MSGEELDTIFSCQRSGLPFPSNKKDSVPVLICLAGFPDTASVWDPLVHQPELQRSHHIIALGLPGYHLDKLPSDHTWGFTIDEIQEALHKVVLYCRRNDSKNIHLLGHDWGALYGYIYVQEHKDDNLIQKYAALDIGISKPSEMPLAGTLKAIGYMVWLALCFVVNNLLGSSFASVLIKLYPWKYIGPLNWKEVSARWHTINHNWAEIAMAYPGNLAEFHFRFFFSFATDLSSSPSTAHEDASCDLSVFPNVPKPQTSCNFFFQNQTPSSVLYVRETEEGQLSFPSIPRQAGGNAWMLVDGI